jgi:hypothetical protein
MAGRMTYETLNQLLLNLGFVRGDATEKNHRVWRHPESGCTLLLPGNKTREAPRPADLVGVKAHLDLHGHLAGDDFELFVAKGTMPAGMSGQE